MHWRRKWQPTSVFLPGESQGWGTPSHVGSHGIGHDWSDLAAAAAAIGYSGEQDQHRYSSQGAYISAMGDGQCIDQLSLMRGKHASGQVEGPMHIYGFQLQWGIQQCSTAYTVFGWHYLSFFVATTWTPHLAPTYLLSSDHLSWEMYHQVYLLTWYTMVFSHQLHQFHSSFPSRDNFYIHICTSLLLSNLGPWDFFLLGQGQLFHLASWSLVWPQALCL